MSNQGIAGIIILLFVIVVIGIFLIPFIFYLIELQNTLKEVKEENRKMKPGQVWLLFIPIFSVYWYFEVVSRIANSLKAEFEERNIQVGEARPGYATGMAICIIGAISFVLGIVFRILSISEINADYYRSGPATQSYLFSTSALVTIILSIVSFILFIIYWVKINGYRKKLIEAKRFNL